MTRINRAFAVIGIMTVAGVAIAFVLLLASVQRGFSARDPPSRLEAAVAQAMRGWSIPRAAKRRVNPIATTPQSLLAARAHFADHCAQCHANDGSGKTEMGANLYPKPPDMRARATQRKSDGELFYIIQNGVRLTGMPAWGEPGRDDDDTWKLVAFIRTLPRLPDADVAAMRRLNPKSPEEWQEEQDEDAFLNGGAAPKSSAHRHEHHGGSE